MLPFRAMATLRACFHADTLRYDTLLPCLIRFLDMLITPLFFAAARSNTYIRCRNITSPAGCQMLLFRHATPDAAALA